MDSRSVWKFVCAIFICASAISNFNVLAENVPTELECRPHIEKALNTVKSDIADIDSAEISIDIDDSTENDQRINLIENIEGSDDTNNGKRISNEYSKEPLNNDNSNEIEGEANNSEEHEETENSNESEDGLGDHGQKKIKNDGTNDQQSNEEDPIGIETSTEMGSSKENGVEKINEAAEEIEEIIETSEEVNPLGSNEKSEEEEETTLHENHDNNAKEIRVERGLSEEDEKEKQTLSIEDHADTTKQNDSLYTDESTRESNEITNDSNETIPENKIISETVEESKEISAKSYPVDDLLFESGIPENLRDRSHIEEILRLSEDSVAQNEALEKVADSTLKQLKRIYENAIKPLETLYKYRDLSNRHFGDPEIFSKPLVLLMGPWSGGKSSIINYLTNNEYTEHSLKTGAEPSHPYFNILMYGETEQVLDGTQLAADWTFSGLQKFGQGLQDRLRGLKLPSKLLKKVNIVEIPGILEVRKQFSRIFPFNDACQWFIDRADIIFLVYDPSKLDVGPETEAILDQLKGREYQTRIILNKADQVHPEELLRVQGALIWNISPLMSSQQPPIMYTVSLWSNPFEENAPVRLLQAQERALLQDLSQAIDHRIENKIASARRFAVRVRNHAKMVDCYLTTYYNHKTLFGNKKKISGEIVSHPQNYHIYEGLSTLTNISRYDLPDPEVYRDFFQLNPLYEFKKLSETCTYFRGCPINKLDVAIAYELPELINRYKRSVAQILNTLELSSGSNDSATDRKDLKD